MRLYCFGVIFQLIVCSSKISMVGRNFWVGSDGFQTQQNFLFIFSEFPHSLTTQIIEIPSLCLFGKLQTSLAGIGQFFPFIQMHVGICHDQVFIFVAGKGFGELNDPFVIFVGLQCLYFLTQLAVCLYQQGMSLLKIVQFYVTRLNFQDLVKANIVKSLKTLDLINYGYFTVFLLQMEEYILQFAFNVNIF